MMSCWLLQQNHVSIHEPLVTVSDRTRECVIALRDHRWRRCCIHGDVIRDREAYHFRTHCPWWAWHHTYRMLYQMFVGFCNAEYSVMHPKTPVPRSGELVLWSVTSIQVSEQKPVSLTEKFAVGTLLWKYRWSCCQGKEGSLPDRQNYFSTQNRVSHLHCCLLKKAVKCWTASTSPACFRVVDTTGL